MLDMASANVEGYLATELPHPEYLKLKAPNGMMTVVHLAKDTFSFKDASLLWASFRRVADRYLLFASGDYFVTQGGHKIYDGVSLMQKLKQMQKSGRSKAEWTLERKSAPISVSGLMSAVPIPRRMSRSMLHARLQLGEKNGI